MRHLDIYGARSLRPGSQVPPRPLGASQSTCTWPADRSTFFILLSAKNPMNLPSGDQNDRSPLRLMSRRLDMRIFLWQPQRGCALSPCHCSIAWRTLWPPSYSLLVRDHQIYRPALPAPSPPVWRAPSSRAAIDSRNVEPGVS